MADDPMDNIPNYPSFFQNSILVNVCYWNDYIKNHEADMAALERERERIITAIVYALNLEQAWPVVHELISTFSSYMERQGQWEAWQRVLKQAIKTAEQLEDQIRTTTLYALLARLSQQQSQPAQAIHYYRKTIQAARATGNLFEEARACSNLGYLFINQGVWYRAEVLCCHALAIFEQINSGHGRAHTENHLGVLYTRQGHWPQAQQHLERACAIWETTEDKHGLMYGLINLSMLCNEMKRPTKSLHYLEKALHLAELTGDEVIIGVIYINTGVAYRLSGEPVQAEMYARQAEAIFQRFSNLHELANVWGNLGLACLDQGKWEEADSYLKASLEAWRQLGNEYGELKTLMDMVEVKVAQDNRTQAMERLNELEQHHHQTHWGKRYPHLQERLKKQRRSLTRGCP